MTQKIKIVGVEEYAYYVNKLRQNIVWKHEYDVECDVTNSTHQKTKDHLMPLNEPPPLKFSAYQVPNTQVVKPDSFYLDIVQAYKTLQPNACIRVP